MHHCICFDLYAYAKDTHQELMLALSICIMTDASAEDMCKELRRALSS